MKDHVAYAASKGAVDSMTQVMALELGPHGIRVNAINPTVVMTELGRRAWADPEKAQTMLSKIPLGRSVYICIYITGLKYMVRNKICIFYRFAEINEVVNAITFLLSDKSSMINGVQLPVDGGFLAT